ncbi:unnamed protein product [Lathyrus oleraceus]
MEPCSKESVDFSTDLNKNNSVSATISDPKILDCHNCFKPLCAPVFQCENGHIACSTCCSKFKNKCQKCRKCSMDIILQRCRVIENLLQCIEIPCPNEKHGCKETITYSRKRNHEEECVYGPCHCPHSDCDFVAIPEELSKHFSNKHRSSRIKFSYGQFFTLSLKSYDETIVLQEEMDDKLFILNHSSTILGTAVNINIIDSISSESEYGYVIWAKSKKCCMKLHASAESVRRVTSPILSSEFLMIPSGYINSSPSTELEIRITFKMQIFIQTESRKRIILKVDSLDTIAMVKEKIHDKNVRQQCLFFDGKKLEDLRSIADYNIKENSILHLIIGPPPPQPPFLFHQFGL